MSLEQYAAHTEVALATTQDAAVTRLTEWAHSADAAYQVATRLSDSAFVPQQFRGKPVETTAAILAGLEVGLSPMQAIRSFDIISGTAAPRAITLRALVQAQGHEMVLVESTTTRCRMKGKRKGSDEWQNVTWTIDRAKDLGLTGKDNWRKQPAAMLVARATSELARLIASDAILGIGYSSEEVADGGNYEQQVSEVTTTPSDEPTTRRMGRRRPLAPVADVEPEPEGPEQAADEPTDDPTTIGMTDRTRGEMFALFAERDITERDAQIDGIVQVIGHPIESRGELTEAEGLEVVASLRGRA